MSSIRWMALAVAAGVLAVGQAPAQDSRTREDGGGSAKVEQLQRQLVGVRKDLGEAQEAAAKVDRQWVQIQHDLVYTNVAIKPLYDEIVQMEKAVAEKRRAMNELLQTMPEMKKYMQERGLAHEKLQTLIRREAEILGQIKAEQARAAGAAK